jgi:tetratricopeptide (TPR) repeat protein
VEPLGTITKYYKFIDEETQNTLNFIMEESSSYSDFVQRIVGVVLEKEVSADLVYIAAAQAWLVRNTELINAITEKYGDLVCIKPWRYVSGEVQYYQQDQFQDIKESLDQVLESSTDDWMIAELLLTYSFNLVIPLETTRMLSIANEIMNQRSDLACVEPVVYLAEGYKIWMEGKTSEARVSCQKGLDLARANDDVVYEFFGLLYLANVTKNFNYRKGLDLFEQAYQIAQDLDVSYFIAEILNDSTMAYEIAGEYDLAISSQLDGINEYSEGGFDVRYSILSRLYAILGEGQQALEWAERALQESTFYIAYLRKARALIILNRFDEAEDVLNIANQMILQTGYDHYLARYHFVSSLLEMAKGEFLSAKRSLEQSYEIIFPLKGMVFLNETLIALAKLDVAMLIQSERSDVVVQGKWLSKLEEHARSHDLPGIAMQAAMIRSELFQYQGQLIDARETLQQALESSDSPGVKTLRKRISTRIQEMNRLLQDEELVS